MSKTTTYTEYAAFSRRPDGSWHKISAFYDKSKKAAELALYYHKKRNPQLAPDDCKIMARTVSVTTGEWMDVADLIG